MEISEIIPGQTVTFFSPYGVIYTAIVRKINRSSPATVTINILDPNSNWYTYDLNSFTKILITVGSKPFRVAASLLKLPSRNLRQNLPEPLAKGLKAAS